MVILFLINNIVFDIVFYSFKDACFANWYSTYNLIIVMILYFILLKMHFYI